MLNRFNMLSVNQSAAQIKLLEAWKSMNVEDYPINLRNERQSEASPSRQVRESTRRTKTEGGRLKSTLASFSRDTGRLWNQAPKTIKEAKTVYAAKSEIRKYCKTLPI